ncbi:MBG domain-containing protein, partial [uncultured Sunxiuqinia sp.]|uniref:MBG domain-containing protein n=1 Tax=uncultured Sunxiuqinia sp. TaxID=1573825 RepID=UPI00261A123C
ITARPITITADAGQTKVYGEADPAAFTYTVGGDGLATGDSFDGALSRDAGETVGNYAINQGTLTIVEGATNKEGNYTVTYVSNDFTITARPITITADAGQTKVYGEADPAAFTYTVGGDGLATGDSFEGALSRITGETVGSYAINQGTLTIVEGATNKESNYTVTYVSNDFAITARPITITADAGQTKVYGE